MNKIRLNKFISYCGICSRRKADELITQGLVKINGSIICKLGTLIDPQKDVIKLRSKVLRLKNSHVYFMFNKPTQVLTSMSDPSDRKTVADFLEGYKKHRLFPVGRLDWDSEGLLILTNNGPYSQKIIHPKEKIPKAYHVKIDKALKATAIQKLKRGVSIVGGQVKATHIFNIRKSKRTTTHSWVSITITEGKNRQVRKMFEKVGVDVIKLRRISIGGLKMGALKKGEIRQIPELSAMKALNTS